MPTADNLLTAKQCATRLTVPGAKGAEVRIDVYQDGTRITATLNVRRGDKRSGAIAHA